MIKKNLLIINILFIIMSLFGCDPKTLPEYDGKANKELLIYCGATMVAPMQAAAEKFEKLNKCKIKFIYGGSGEILNIFLLHEKGDLFLPGSENYIKRLEEKNFIADKKIIGYNQAILFVKKGNPKRIKNDINELIRQDLRVAIGSSDAGSIGNETKNILSKIGLYEKVLENAFFITTDSKRLADGFREETIDLTLNWKAKYSQNSNYLYMDYLEVDEDKAEKHPLYLALLQTSEEKELAKMFINFVLSEEGEEIFNKHGFR